MLKFNIDLLRSSYVYILKVTADYIYVTTTRAGAPYRVSSSIQETYKGYPVSKIRIHRSVSHAYSQFYASREFPRPRLASLNYYGDDIVSIEVQLVNSRLKDYQDANNWQSYFSRVIQRLRSHLEGVPEAWINGTEIFWMEADSEGKSNELSICHEGYLSVRAVNFVRLASMGLSVLASLNARTEISAKNGVGESSIDDIVNSADLRIQSGKVLTYYPNAQNPGAERIAVFSPVLQQKKLNTAHSNPKSDYTVDEERKVFSLTSEVDPAYANIDFAIRAANTIGKLYGYEEVDDLDIPRIIEQTGEVNLMNIDSMSRRTTPIHMSALSCLAFVFRYIYRENDLNRMRDLSKMFRFCINKGLVYRSDVSSLLRDDAPSNKIPLGKVPHEICTGMDLIRKSNYCETNGSAQQLV